MRPGFCICAHLFILDAQTIAYFSRVMARRGFSTSAPHLQQHRCAVLHHVVANASQWFITTPVCTPFCTLYFVVQQTTSSKVSS